MKHSVAIIGVGTVGSSIANALLLKNIVAELVLLDKDEARCAGQVKDLSDTLGFSYAHKVIQGTYEKVKQADIVIIAAGRPQRQGESRLHLIESNKVILDSILKNLKGLKESAIVIVVSNPLDVLTYCTLKELGLPRRQVFGTGTYLDSQRLSSLLSQRLQVGQDSVASLVLGEHGDSQVIVWSATKVGGLSIDHFITEEDKIVIEKEIRESAYDIIQKKGSTSYGIAACVASLCQIIFYNTYDIVPVSWYHSGFGACMSMPVVLSENGIERVVPLALTEDELALLKKSAEVLKRYQEKVD